LDIKNLIEKGGFKMLKKCLVMIMLLIFSSQVVLGEEEKLASDKPYLRLNIHLAPPIPDFDELMMGIQKARPNGYNSPMETWEALGLYAQQGTAFWIMAVCHARNVNEKMRSPWSIFPLAKQNSKGDLNAMMQNMLTIGEKLEVRFTMVRTLSDSNYVGVNMDVFKRDLLLGKIPAPLCPPDFGDVMNLMRTFLHEEFSPPSAAYLQMETSYSVTPAGLFVMSVNRDGFLNQHFRRNKFANLEQAELALRKFPSTVPSFTAKSRYSAKMLSQGYSDVALARLEKGNDATVLKEFAAKQKMLAEYVELLAKNGVVLKFFPFQNQEKFWKDKK
jgi:hypothetical protein